MWIKGRQNGSYWKFKIFESIRLKMDCYLLKFPVGSYIEPHKDPVSDGNHCRINIVLKRAKKGGTFMINGRRHRKQRFIAFRPDVFEHSVVKVRKGTRYVLSIGFVTSR